MKKIITLLFCVGTVTAAFAQTPQEEARKVILNGGKNTRTDRDSRNSRDVILGGDRRVYDEQGNYPAGSRDAQVERINRDYDAKIQSIRNNPYLSAEEKERMIRQLNNERARAIRQVNGQTAERRDRRYDDGDYKKDKKYKSNNGNHYGWEKGKGNPHRNGGHPGKGNGKGKGKN